MVGLMADFGLYKFLKTDETITANKYCQQMNEMFVLMLTLVNNTRLHVSQITNQELNQLNASLTILP